MFNCKCLSRTINPHHWYLEYKKHFSPKAAKQRTRPSANHLCLGLLTSSALVEFKCAALSFKGWVHFVFILFQYMVEGGRLCHLKGSSRLQWYLSTRAGMTTNTREPRAEFEGGLRLVVFEGVAELLLSVGGDELLRRGGGTELMSGAKLRYWARREGWLKSCWMRGTE